MTPDRRRKQIRRLPSKPRQTIQHKLLVINKVRCCPFTSASVTLPIVESAYNAEHTANPAVAFFETSIVLSNSKRKLTSPELKPGTLYRKSALSCKVFPNLPNVMPKTGSPGLILVTPAPTDSIIPQYSPPVG